ncbi:MAG TPA: glycerophosphodiester phosphodiesterase [Gemmatimonadaceae bacterium]
MDEQQRGGVDAGILVDPAARPVIAHRGASAHFPENTIPSFDRAVELGADAIEFDLRVSRDGEVVIIHDPTVDRTTDGTGAVDSLTLANLKRLDAGARFTPDGGKTFPFRGRGLTVPTFDEVLARYTSLPLLIEVKIPQAGRLAPDVLGRHDAGARVVLDSTDADALEPFRGLPLITGASLRDIVTKLPRILLGLPLGQVAYRAFCVPLWYNGIPVPVRRLAKTGHRAGFATHVWTVNDPRVAERLWSSGINGIISDDPGTMLELRRRVFSAEPAMKGAQRR